MEKIESSTRLASPSTTKVQQNAWLFEIIRMFVPLNESTPLFLSVIITISVDLKKFGQKLGFYSIGETDFASNVAVNSQQNAWLFETIRMYTTLNESTPHLVPLMYLNFCYFS